MMDKIFDMIDAIRKKPANFKATLAFLVSAIITLIFAFFLVSNTVSTTRTKLKDSDVIGGILPSMSKIEDSVIRNDSQVLKREDNPIEYLGSSEIDQSNSENISTSTSGSVNR